MGTNTKIIFSDILGDIFSIFQNYGTILLLCCAFILIDLATGLSKAKIQGRINSSIGYKGFWRKTALLVALFFGICLDLLISYVSDSSFISPVGKILGIYIAINECISISENLIACGVKLPPFIATALDTAQTKLNKQNRH